LNAINDKGVSYQALHDYGRAAVYYYDVISKAGAVSFNDIKARAWYNLAILNQDNGNLQDALRLYSIAGNLYKTTPGKSYQLLNVYLAKGRIYSDLHLADSAERYFKLGKTLSAILESNSSMIDALLQEAVSLRMSGKFSDAGKDIAQAYELSMKEFDRSKQADVLIEMGELAMAQKDYPGAVMHYEKSYTIASQLQNVDQCSLASKGLSKAYEGLGKIEMAYHYLNIYNNWKDSVPDVSSRVQFEQVRDLYNLELKNTEIRLLRQENEINNLKLDQRKRLLISTGFILLISFLFLFFMYRSRGKTAEVNALLDKKNREIEWQNVRLERSNKDLEQFAYITSHDLNQPLRNISSFAEILERKYGDKLDKDGLEFIQFIKGSASRMSVLLHDLLAYSKIQTQQHEFSSVDLNAVLEVVKQNLKVGIDETGTTIVLLTPLPVIDAYETLMVQLMQNLISNSIKYSKDGIPPVIIIETKVQDGNLEISFSDNGIGFDNAYAERVFSLFKRLHTSEEYEGSGIGLSICKRIMERHYGNIKVDSKEGVGTTMTLVFPASVLRSKKQQQL
jgi:signal transduction histidine kinase